MAEKSLRVRTVEDVRRLVNDQVSQVDIAKSDIVLRREIIVQKEIFNGRAHSPVFYELCQQILEEYPFERGKNAGQRRFIFELHAEGFTEAAISFWLKKSVYKAMSPSGVHKVIQSVKNEFMTNIYSQKIRLDVDRPQLLKRNADIKYIYDVFDIIRVRDMIELEDKNFIETMLAEGRDPEFVIRDALDRIRNR